MPDTPRILEYPSPDIYPGPDLYPDIVIGVEHQPPPADEVIPQLAVPFRVEGKDAVVVEQDSDADILQCVEAILSYRRGERPEAPDFGVPDQAHRQGGADLAELADAIERFEARAHDLAASLDTDLLGLTQRVSMLYGADRG